MLFNIFTIAALAPFALAQPLSQVSEDTSLVTRSIDAANFNFTKEFEPGLNSIFEAFLAIPDEVLKEGDDSVHKWLVDHGFRNADAILDLDDDNNNNIPDILENEGDVQTRDDGNVVTLAARGWWEVTKCVAAIAQVIGTTAIPAAKLLRIKKYIQELGGIKDTVKLLLGATSKAEKLKAGGEALVLLSSELLGITLIQKNC